MRRLISRPLTMKSAPSRAGASSRLPSSDISVVRESSRCAASPIARRCSSVTSVRSSVPAPVSPSFSPRAQVPAHVPAHVSSPAQAPGAGTGGAAGRRPVSPMTITLSYEGTSSLARTQGSVMSPPWKATSRRLRAPAMPEAARIVASSPSATTSRVLPGLTNWSSCSTMSGARRFQPRRSRRSVRGVPGRAVTIASSSTQDEASAGTAVSSSSETRMIRSLAPIGVPGSGLSATRPSACSRPTTEDVVNASRVSPKVRPARSRAAAV